MRNPKCNSVVPFAGSGAVLAAFAIIIFQTLGCVAANNKPAPSVSTAWQNGPAASEAPAPSGRPLPVKSQKLHVVVPRPLPDPVAGVDGRAIALYQLLDLLFRSHGPDILEQLIVLQAAEQKAAERGLTVSDADVQAEYDLALHRLTSALPSITPMGDSQDESERVLDAVLVERRVSREEFRLGIRRNAFLRKLAESELTVTEEQVSAEFQRRSSPRVQVRHIQLATLGEVARVREQLAAGSDFAELARKYSANTASAPSGGLLDPFHADDESLPPLFRQTAFALTPGSVSDAVRLGTWYHLLKHERTLPPEVVSLESGRDEIGKKLRATLAEEAMQRLYARLLKDAKIQIHDPVLKAAFEGRRTAQGD